MPGMRSFRDLEVWQQAMRLTQMVYALALKLPRQETYVLSDQLRRAALSVPANIAEGQGRRTDGAFARHIDIALGSIAELETLLQIAIDLGFCDASEVEPLFRQVTRVRQMLYGLYRRLKRTAHRAPREDT